MENPLAGEDLVWATRHGVHRLPAVRGEPPHFKTVQRYITRGRHSKLNGHVVRLEGFQEMDALCTSMEAWDRFHARLNDLHYVCPGCPECEDPQ